MSKGYYHVCSHGLERTDIFKTRADFIAGMNDVALCVIGFDLKILCFCLMSNHFHFVLYGTERECRRFADVYKHRCAMRMRRHSGEVHGMKDVEVQVFPITSHEYLENVIAYVLRNPIAAGIFMMPYHYKWSSLMLYFNAGQQLAGQFLNQMSDRKRFQILKSRVSVPDHYMVDCEGIILPSCYVDFVTVEKIFRHPARLMAALARKVENDVEVVMGISDTVQMTDQEIKSQLSELLIKEFGKESITQLSMDQRMRLCLLLKRNFRSGVKQISRITRLDPAVVAKVV
jgi:REP element-mobilizing transposase RayT